MSGLVLAIDQGTTSSRAILFDSHMKVVGVGQKEFAQHYPASGWVEHDPEEIWSSALWSVRAALKDFGGEASRIAALGITNQRETVVIWDRATGKPIHNAIVWQDRRTAPLCQKLKKQGLEKKFTKKTGLAARSLFFRYQDRLGAGQGEGREEACGTRRASGRHHRQFPDLAADGGKTHATDATNASRTLVYNIADQ